MIAPRENSLVNESVTSGHSNHGGRAIVDSIPMPGCTDSGSLKQQ